MFCHQILLIQVTPISSRYWKLLILAYSPRWLRAPCTKHSHEKHAIVKQEEAYPHPTQSLIGMWTALLSKLQRSER